MNDSMNTMSLLEEDGLDFGYISNLEVNSEDVLNNTAEEFDIQLESKDLIDDLKEEFGDILLDTQSDMLDKSLENITSFMPNDDMEINNSLNMTDEMNIEDCLEVIDNIDISKEDNRYSSYDNTSSIDEYLTSEIGIPCEIDNISKIMSVKYSTRDLNTLVLAYPIKEEFILGDYTSADVENIKELLLDNDSQISKYLMYAFRLGIGAQDIGINEEQVIDIQNLREYVGQNYNVNSEIIRDILKTYSCRSLNNDLTKVGIIIYPSELTCDGITLNVLTIPNSDSYNNNLFDIYTIKIVEGRIIEGTEQHSINPAEFYIDFLLYVASNAQKKRYSLNSNHSYVTKQLNLYWNNKRSMAPKRFKVIGSKPICEDLYSLKYTYTGVVVAQDVENPYVSIPTNDGKGYITFIPDNNLEHVKNTIEIIRGLNWEIINTRYRLDLLGDYNEPGEVFIEDIAKNISTTEYAMNLKWVRDNLYQDAKGIGIIKSFERLLLVILSESNDLYINELYITEDNKIQIDNEHISKEDVEFLDIAYEHLALTWLQFENEYFSELESEFSLRFQ